MKNYIQFKCLSTGYAEGTIPPKFSKECIRAIDCLGSDGRVWLDGRLSLNSMVSEGVRLCTARGNKVGFSVVRKGKESEVVLF